MERGKTMARKKMHMNSMEAFHDLKPDARRKLILNVFWKFYPQAISDRMVAQELGFSDMNCVRPRITELKEECLIRETTKKRDETTGMPVRFSRPTTEEEREEWKKQQDTGQLTLWGE